MIGCENIGKTTDNILVRDNIFYDNQISALALGGFDYPNRGKVITCRFSNNTCYKNNYNNDQNGEIVLTYSENCVIENNIFYLSAQNFLAAASISQPSLTFDYNLVYSDNSPANLGTNWNGMEYVSFAAFVANTGTNTYSNIGNPLFVDANITSPNFHILANSAAKEAGNPLFFTGLNETDIDGENRKAGLVDCGIDEYYANTSIEPALQMILIYPNPVADKMLILGENIKGFSIYNQFGENVREIVNNQAVKIEIDLSELPSGLYFLQTNTGICAKIVKVK